MDLGLAVVGYESDSFGKERVYIDVAELVRVVNLFGELIDCDSLRCRGTAGRIVVLIGCVRNKVQDFHKRNRGRLAIFGGAFNVVVK